MVLDPFVGSGTTCLVAKNLGRDYHACDLSQEYCDMAIQRLAGTFNCEKSVKAEGSDPQYGLSGTGLHPERRLNEKLYEK